ncbi:hypothetical protein BDY21DRAFT_130628 [Lineolata rhizophorae]|uniref:Uncharacterized protein n=1 Tax=Lineolata rhizophorae TaxID=578093 RepID=A0A6A6PA00_9PEZI|nr:hypothetical protein BDY21DRAFT_130628 [Lineolata rhizophorae]
MFWSTRCEIRLLLSSALGWRSVGPIGQGGGGGEVKKAARGTRRKEGGRSKEKGSEVGSHREGGKPEACMLRANPQMYVCRSRRRDRTGGAGLEMGTNRCRERRGGVSVGGREQSRSANR